MSIFSRPKYYIYGYENVLAGTIVLQTQSDKARTHGELNKNERQIVKNP